MRIIHLSDLHLGKRVNGYSMIEDQAYILDEILQICDAEQPQAVLLAGDIYDKPVPPEEAVALFDRFLRSLTDRSIRVLAISGNHDSAERLAFASSLLARSGVHIAPVYQGETAPVELTDEFGPVRFFLLPFIKPAHMRRFAPDAVLETYTDAVREAIRRMPLDPEKRNVLVTHQFVTGAERCESEEISVGGTDNVDASVFQPFDYVALGHIHGPQQVTRETIRYCGTPLKYSFSEKNHIKSVTVAELLEKGMVQLRTVPLKPLRDLREIRGTYAELTDRRSYAGTRTDDYLRVILTDEEDVPEALARLRTIYPNIMKLEYDNRRTQAVLDENVAVYVENRTAPEIFDAFYRQQNGREMSEKQAAYMSGLFARLQEVTE